MVPGEKNRRQFLRAIIEFRILKGQGYLFRYSGSDETVYDQTGTFPDLAPAGGK
jgi:hypothetical protein